MNTNDKNTNNRNDRSQPANTNETNRRDDEQFWAEWWREYAQTWK